MTDISMANEVSGRYDARMPRPPSTRQRGDADIAAVAKLLADSTRSAMLWALSDGRALPAGELDRVAGVQAATASANLAKLVAAQLIAVEAQGRHRYYRVASGEVVRVLEALATLSTHHFDGISPHPAVSGVRLARTCYDHLAGRAGVGVTAALLDTGYLSEVESGYDVTISGTAWFERLGIRVADVHQRAQRTRRIFARACLDWSERRHHVAGVLGAALCHRMLEIEWFERLPATRALRVTNEGRRELRRRLGVALY